MANQFWATTKIKFGKRAEDGSQEGKYESKVFEPGDEVTGLSKEDMKSLWDAGALRKTRPKATTRKRRGPSPPLSPPSRRRLRLRLRRRRSLSTRGPQLAVSPSE